MTLLRYVFRARIVAISCIVAISIVIGSVIAINVPKSYTATAQIAAGSNGTTLNTTKELVNNGLFSKLVKQQVSLKSSRLKKENLKELVTNTNFVINNSKSTASIEVTGTRRRETALVANQTAQIVVDNIGKYVPGARYYVVKTADVFTQPYQPRAIKILFISFLIGTLIGIVYAYVTLHFWGVIESKEYLDAFYQFEFVVNGKISSIGKE